MAGAMDTFRSIEAFERAAEAQGFAAATRQLGVAKSVVTTPVQQLEEFVSAALGDRTQKAGIRASPRDTSLASSATRSVDSGHRHRAA